MHHSLPAALEHFLERHIDSLVALDVLLLLRTESLRSWRVDDIAAALGLRDVVASRALSDLGARGLLVEVRSAWQLAEHPPETELLLGALEAEHRRDRGAVAEVVTTQFLRRLRLMTVAYRTMS